MPIMGALPPQFQKILPRLKLTILTLTEITCESQGNIIIPTKSCNNLQMNALLSYLSILMKIPFKIKLIVANLT